MFPFRSRHSEALHHLFMDFINENTVFPHQLHGTVSWSFARTSGFFLSCVTLSAESPRGVPSHFSSSPFSLFLAFNELLRVASSLLFFFSLYFSLLSTFLISAGAFFTTLRREKNST
jgi:hypothetical protein